MEARQKGNKKSPQSDQGEGKGETEKEDRKDPTTGANSSYEDVKEIVASGRNDMQKKALKYFRVGVGKRNGEKGGEFWERKRMRTLFSVIYVQDTSQKKGSFDTVTRKGHSLP